MGATCSGSGWQARCSYFSHRDACSRYRALLEEDSVIARKRLLLVLPMLLLVAVSAKADGVDATVYFNGNYAFANNGFGVPPYGGTLNGQNAEFFCVDFSHEITGHTSWQAAVTDLGGSADFSSTLQGNQNTYEEFAWLIDQMNSATDQTTKAEYQWAIWSLSGGVDPYGAGSASTLLTDAQNAVYGGFTGQGWIVLTPTGKYGQEFMTQVPEPSSLMLLGIGLAALMLTGKRRLLA